MKSKSVAVMAALVAAETAMVTKIKKDFSKVFYDYIRSAVTE